MTNVNPLMSLTELIWKFLNSLKLKKIFCFWKRYKNIRPLWLAIVFIFLIRKIWVKRLLERKRSCCEQRHNELTELWSADLCKTEPSAQWWTGTSVMHRWVCISAQWSKTSLPSVTDISLTFSFPTATSSKRSTILWL